MDGRAIKTERVETGYSSPRYYNFPTLQQGIDVLSGSAFEGTLSPTKRSITYRENNLTIVNSVESY